MDIRVILLFTVAVVTALLSFFTVRSGNGKDPAGRAFSLFVVAASFWALFIALFNLSQTKFTSLLFANIYYVAAVGIATFFLYFSYKFPGEKKFTPIIKIVIFTPIIILGVLLIYNPSIIIQSISNAPWGKTAQLQFISYLLYNIYFAVFILWAYKNLIHSYIAAEEGSKEKKQLRLIFLGTVIPYLVGMTTNLFLPWFTYQYIWIGPLVAFIMVVAIAFAISRENLMDVRVIGAEFFSVLLLVILLVRFLLSQTMQDFLLGGVILITTAIFGVFLVRSVWREVRIREKMEDLAWELEQANVRLKELDQAKTEFISIASHQLRTPVTAIKGYSSMALEGSFGDVPEKLRQPIDRIYQSSENLVKIIENFLNVSRIELGKMQYDFTTFDLREVIKSSVDNARVAFLKSDKKRDIEIKFTDNVHEAVPVHADKGKITQVIGNLIDNALKYTPGGEIEIRFSKDDDERIALIAIRDTGIGLAREDIAGLFEKFKRVNGSANIHASGSGLGLYVAREIMKEHKGKVWVESPGEGKGSTFFVEVPLTGVENT